VIGLVVLTPVMALLFFFVVAAGRVGVVESKLTAAARGAARAVSQSRSTDAAGAGAGAIPDPAFGHCAGEGEGGPMVGV